MIPEYILVNLEDEDEPDIYLTGESQDIDEIVDIKKNKPLHYIYKLVKSL